MEKKSKAISGFCKLCLQYAILVESHILQKAIYNDPYSKEKISSIYSEKTKVSQKYPQGVYGRYLCGSCENEFQLIDDKGFKLLFEEKHESFFVLGTGLKDNIIQVSQISEGSKYNHKELLILYFISILWRASVSDRKEFSTIKLGEKFVDKARLAVINNDSSYFPELDVVISKFDNGVSGFILPLKQKFGDVNGYRIALPYFSCLVKVDRRVFPSQLLGVSLRTSGSILILHRDWKISFELKAMRSILKKCA